MNLPKVSAQEVLINIQCRYRDGKWYWVENDIEIGPVRITNCSVPGCNCTRA